MERQHLLELRKLGLSAAESRVYLTLVEIGSGLVSTIARKSGVARTNCYHTLKTLSDKGLVSITNQGSRRIYLAETPRKLVVAERQRLAVAETLVPSLVALAKTTTGLAPRMRYFEGISGITDVLMQSLETKTDLVVYTHIGLLTEKFPETLHAYCKGQAEKRTRVRIISPYSERAEHFISHYYPAVYSKEYLEVLYVNPREFSLESHVVIFDDKVSMISLGREENIGVTIESRAYADTSRATFNLSWLGATSFVAQ